MDVQLARTAGGLKRVPPWFRIHHRQRDRTSDVLFHLHPGLGALFQAHVKGEKKRQRKTGLRERPQSTASGWKLEKPHRLPGGALQVPTGTFCRVQTQGAPAAGRQKSVAYPLRIIQITHTLAGGRSSALAGCIRLWAISVPAGRADGRWSSKLAGFCTMAVISLFSAAIPSFLSVLSAGLKRPSVSSDW